MYVVVNTATSTRGAYTQIDHELAVIAELGFAGYFLTVTVVVRLAEVSLLVPPYLTVSLCLPALVIFG